MNSIRKGVVLSVLSAVVSTIGFSFTACSEKKGDAAADSIATDTVAADTQTISVSEEAIAETPMPRAADELFDDFFFNFASNRKLQAKRIKFPLPVFHEDSVQRRISPSEWTTERFFMDQDYYTLIFNSQKQMGIVKDTTVGHAAVEKIYLNKHKVKKYVFDRINGRWMMTSIRDEHFKSNENSSFLAFYSRFAADTTFQVKSVNDPLDFTGPSPLDEFEDMDGFIAPEQWLSFAPVLPQGTIYNILYGEQKNTESNRKIFVIRGISNGQETELTFRIKDGGWKLVKLNM